MGGARQKQGANREIFIQIRGDSGRDQGDSNENGKKWSDCGSGLKGEMVGFADELDVVGI